MKVGKVVGVENWGQPEKLQLDVEEQIRKAETDRKGKGGPEGEASSPQSWNVNRSVPATVGGVHTG